MPVGWRGIIKQSEVNGALLCYVAAEALDGLGFFFVVACAVPLDSRDTGRVA